MKNINVVHLNVVKEKSFRYEINQIKSPNDAINVLNQFINDYCNNDRENFIIMCLDTKNKINALNIVSIGTLNSSSVHPREVFKLAILSNSYSIIICHNHPSGDPAPSKEDVEITNRLVKCSNILGVNILDHIIIGDFQNYSFKEHGRM